MFFDSSIAGPKDILQCGASKVSYTKTGYPVRRYIRCLAFFHDPVFWRRRSDTKARRSLWSALPSTIGRCDIRSITHAVRKVLSFNERCYLGTMYLLPSAAYNASDIVLIPSITAARLCLFVRGPLSWLNLPNCDQGLKPVCNFDEFPVLRDTAECTLLHQPPHLRRLEVEEKVET